MRLLPIVVMIALFSGCVGQDPAPQSVENVPEEEMIEAFGEFELEHGQFDWRLNAAVGAAYSVYVSPAGSRSGTFQVGENATVLTFATGWTCATGELCNMMVAVWHNENWLETVRASDEIEIEYVAPGAGEYEFVFWPDSQGSAAVEAYGTAILSALYHTPADAEFGA